MHTGLDIAAPTGTPIASAGGGEVIFAGRKGGYGNAVIIDHGHGKTTLYGHMSRIQVRMGQVVKRGQLVGNVGSTGFSTGPHLHYEVRQNGTPINPL
jgi:murein DD-endopeptidase MepM/ murein hydrolase activator NlpD